MNARLMVADSEQNADLFYATGIFVPDPFIWLETGGRTMVVMSDLELDRVRQCATVDRVLPLSRYLRRLRRDGRPHPGLSDVLQALLRDYRIRRVEVPRSFPLGLAQRLRGIRLHATREEFFPARAVKTATDIRKLEAALRMTEEGMSVAIRTLRSCRIGRDGYLHRRGRRFTSEDVQGEINASIARAGGLAQHTIVAGGNHACDPHETGHGPLRAHQPIILDIFPRDLKSGYFGDMTRTVVRGRASEGVKKMYATVVQAQELALERLRAGVDGKDIHDAIVALFRREGFPTERKNGRMQGFFHGTGHGLGLEVHEAPRVGGVSQKLQAGHVVTVEPGLYYWGTGGVRMEDVVVIRDRGVRVLTRFPKRLEI